VLLLAALTLAAPSVYAECSLTSTGNIPIDDLGPSNYHGFSGGLYPGGAINPQPPHAAAALAIATDQIKPLDAWCNVDLGFTWLCSDLDPDFVQPIATGGVPKVATHLLAFFKTDPTATPWLLRGTVSGQPPTMSASATLSTCETYDPDANTAKTFIYTGLSIAVSAGDTTAFKVMTPAWGNHSTFSSSDLLVWSD